ncbi:hypothetical protein IMG5_193500 [Ichthyophthirius multifiliis]|uniref:Adenylate kinase n=1 Tax=Ichthyophthirius multifiliis TaxID=5932 RepID=G0R4J9_ICHMU|nr:hypothetical protein IMG5_193500 [Ichthyophthirius multifiliis]EGR27597.1 hypothetical protein IMG5_193500 [Ichthyophthirius multifiliis]|eukprot:XP_004025049.1 hypothetical protein IMG5_193500 [Ichthyophthirius multifiliis]
MDKTSKLDYQQEVEMYLEENKVYDIFENLMKDIVKDQPAQPLDYLIKKLGEPTQKRVFLVGPPGSNTTELALQLANEFKFTCISVGDLLKKQISMKNQQGEEIEKAISNVQYVDDETVIDIVQSEIQEMEKKNKNYFLEGFPKTRLQCIALQKAGIHPNTFIILNKEEDKIRDGCLKKIQNNYEGYYSNIQEQKKEEYANNHALEYILHLNNVKEMYARYYFDVDANNDSLIPELLEDMAHLMEFKIKPKAPKKSARILVIGPPGSGRSTLSKQLAQKYGLLYVSTTQLISNQIAQKTEIGKIALQLLSLGELIPDEIIIGLVDNRIRQTDCSIQGYVLDGFPKNLVQQLSLEDLQIYPSLIVHLECSDEVVFQRFQEKKVDPITGIVYDKFNPSNDHEINKRLAENPNEKKEIVSKRLQRWKELLKSMEQSFSRIILKIQASQNPLNILEKVSFHIENSL